MRIDREGAPTPRRGTEGRDNGRMFVPLLLMKPSSALTSTSQFFAAKAFAFLRQAAPEVKIYTWYPSAALSGFYLFGPESLGGRGNLLEKAKAEVARTGKPFDVVAPEVRRFRFIERAGRC